MKKNKYIKPATGVVNVQTYGRMLAGSHDNWADSKSHKKGLWVTMLMNMMSLPIPIGQAIRKIHLHGESD